MQKQTVRQQARARARQARAKVVQEQAKRERRLARCGEAVAVALAERDAVVSECEQRAGRALRTLIEDEGLNTQEALVWCGGGGSLTGREVYRLMRGVVDDEEGGNGGEGDKDEVEGGAGGANEQGQGSREISPASAGPAESMPG